MDRLAKLVTAALLLGAGAAHAGYAQLAPPAGFGGSAGNWTFAPSANDVRYGSTAYSPSALRVPGTSATMPAAYRFAANAPRIAAAAIFVNPYVRVGVGIASWLGIASLVWDEATGTWRQKSPLSPFDVTQYRVNDSMPWASSFDAACSAYVGSFSSPTYSYKLVHCHDAGGRYETIADGLVWNSSLFGMQKRTTSGEKCPEGWTSSDAGCLSPQLQQPEFVEKLNPPNSGNPMPEPVPWELPPGTPLPVDPPVVNPEPVPNPVPRPLFIPVGDPVPNPEYNPDAPPGPNNQRWLQPGTRVVPSPTPQEPWRVDLQPVNRPVGGPEPMLEPDSETPPDGDKPREEQMDFCVKNPDVLACQKLDEPNSEELPASEKTISISPDGGWGADNASCPAPKQITVQGRAIPIPFDLFCTWARGMRPIIIAMAWLSAAFILLGARNES
jgi:hypothetical protein